jgi:hypothetical protein
LAATGCAGLSEPACRNGHLVANESLYFGTTKPGGTVSEQEWRQFVDSAITPRFPQGLTVWRASGQWQGANGAIVREPSYILNLVHPDDAAAQTAVDEIVDAYQRRFHQESVLRVREGACASF